MTSSTLKQKLFCLWWRSILIGYLTAIQTDWREFIAEDWQTPIKTGTDFQIVTYIPRRAGACL